MHTIKNIIRRTGIFFLLALICPAPYLGAQSQHSLVEYTTDDGLSLNSVNDLLFDRQGFLWITTADGLQRFDGYRFHTFRHDPNNKKSPVENSVSEIFEDSNGNLWITHRTGIYFKPKGKNEFTDLSASLLGNNPLRYPLSCVSETDSSVFILVYPLGIYEIKKTTFHVSKVSSLPDIFNRAGIYCIARCRGKNQHAWFRKTGDKTGDLYEVTPGGIKHHPNDKKIRVHFLMQTLNDSLIIVSDKLLYKAVSGNPFTPARILMDPFDAGDFDEFAPLPKKVANDQYLLPGIKNIWVYDPVKENVSRFPYDEYLPPEQIRYLHTATADDHHNSWLGYNGIGGIKVISLQKFNLFKRPDINSLTYCLASDEQGNIFAGIYLGDIEVYDNKGKFLKKIALPQKDKRLGSPRAMAMIDSVNLIVKSTLNELYVIHTKKGTVRSLTKLLPFTDSLFMTFELGIQKIQDNEVWVSYYNKLLSIKKRGNEFSSTVICTLSPKEIITSFYYSKAGQLWIGTVSGGRVYNHIGGESDTLPLPKTYVKQINRHRNGNIWFATTNGIYILHEKKLIRKLTTENGLPNSFVYSVLFDEGDNAWVSTNRGIARIDTAFRITNYSAREGLQGDEFNTKGYYKGSDGTLYFAGVNGINFFKPKDLVSKSEPSTTMLTEIEVNNLPYLPQLQPEFISSISLPYQQNNIRLSFSCMDFTVPEKNQYKFWLKGFQDDWSLPQKNNTVQYILPPGEYDLHVLSANYEGIWSKKPLVLHISILPPWYQTTWAMIIFAIFILSIVAAVFFFISRTRYQRKLRKLQMEQEVQKEKQRLSRDLHDNLGAQITWLSNNIQQVQTAQEHEQPTEQKMTRLKEGAGELMQTLRETIWILNKDKVSGIDFFDKLVNHAVKYLEAYPSIQLQTEENIIAEIQLNSGMALQLFRICQEVITNACKHSGASKLEIKADSKDSRFSIGISDNGKGFDISSENLSGHYGLQNMKQRAEESGLTLNIQSAPGKGTHITIATSM